MAKMSQAGVGGVRGESREKEPKRADATDKSGERKVKMKAGVALGEMDDIKGREASHLGKQEGLVGEFNSGAKEHECYDHKRWA